MISAAQANIVVMVKNLQPGDVLTEYVGRELIVQELRRYPRVKHAVFVRFTNGKEKKFAENTQVKVRRGVSMSVSASEQDAQRRLIEAAGMPFPIAEDKQHVVSRLYKAGHPYEKSVPVSLLTATQRDYDTDKVIKFMNGEVPEADKPIRVIKHLNRYVIDDGHHRAMAAKYKGERMVKALVVEA